MVWYIDFLDRFSRRTFYFLDLATKRYWKTCASQQIDILGFASCLESNKAPNRGRWAGIFNPQTRYFGPMAFAGNSLGALSCAIGMAFLAFTSLPRYPSFDPCPYFHDIKSLVWQCPWHDMIRKFGDV